MNGSSVERLSTSEARNRTAGGRLVKIGLVTHGLQLCGHFPGVAGMDAIVAPAHRDQDL